MFHASLLKQSESLIDQEFHLRSVQGRCNWISTLLAASNCAGFAYLACDDKDCLKVFQAAKNALPPQEMGLALEFRDDAQQKARMDQCAQSIKNLLSLMDAAITNHNSKPQQRQELAQMVHAKFLPAWLGLYQLRHEIFLADLARWRYNDESLPAKRKQRKDNVLILVLIDFLAGCGILYFYTHGLTTRLSVLAENAKLFAKKQTLKPRVSGADEISDVDSAFHEMSESLQLAQKRKQEFVSMISHDMRTPLANVQASLEFVLEHPTEHLPEGTRLWLDRAYGNVDTVLRLINELLEIERIEEGELKLELSEVQVTDLIRKSADVVRATAQQNSIAIIEPAFQGYVRCDEDRMIRVLVNLLGNAIKFSPKDSKITIACSHRTDWFELSVQDEGRGIPPEFIAKVFERFKQVSAEDARKLGGSGLGLAISKAIVEAHGGIIDVSSEPGKGSKFRILLPANLLSDTEPE